jgi:GntR family transcriptional regulator/MocR family aminotransferase
VSVATQLTSQDLPPSAEKACSNRIESGVISEIAAGHFARHLRRTRQLYRERRSVLVEALRKELGGSLEVLGEQAGVHLVARLKVRRSDREVVLEAARQGVWTMPLSACYLGRPTSQGLVLGYGGSNASAIPAAVRRLRDVLEPRRES